MCFLLKHNLGDCIVYLDSLDMYGLLYGHGQRPRSFHHDALSLFLDSV